jgi:leucyl-tRNA synthetase
VAKVLKNTASIDDLRHGTFCCCVQLRIFARLTKKSIRCMEYHFREVEQKWQKYWAENKTFKAENKFDKPKYYVLDMFPYPSGAGLHVGHPLGYIASDIFARYKRLKGFNVLHPMGYDSFGLPAEQYAIQTGQHPELTTKTNIARYREQLDKIGFSFDWDREVRTSNPDYYKWTQWIFIQLFNSWYNPETNKAENISTLIEKFKIQGLKFKVDSGEKIFDELNEKQQSDILLEYRLAYLSDTMVNWCPQLGTVLANEEVKDGVSERGGYPVERKLMKQWSMRITAYAERLLNDLDTVDWTESIKEAQRNWIGKSEGTSLLFRVSPSPSGEGWGEVEVFTTRPDTVFGVSFLTLAPEHELVEKITTPEQKKQVDEYITFAKNRSERERMADVKKITGVFTGAYAIHPFTGKQIPIWIGDYVLAGYGTGAVMAVPAHDSRDYAFAKHFELPILEVVSGGDISKESYDAKQGKLINSDFLNGLEVKEAMKKAIAAIEEKNLGKGKINYRLRDAIFGRQRYWGEPIPVYYKDGIPHVLNENELPLLLPEVDKYLPTESGEPPLARAANWNYKPLSSSPRGGENAGLAWQTAANSTWEELKKRSNELRNNPTEAESVLWKFLKAKQLDGKFRRQHVIGNNIVDFVCLDKQLILEVDGKIHEKQIEYDKARTQELKSLGFEVMRFTNEEVLADIDSVIEKIKTALSEKVLPHGEDLGGAYPYEYSTMPGWAGSSWYYLRYMDAHNDKVLASKDAISYWQNVDLYIGGSEHATGHLLYVRFWTKFLHDIGIVPFVEPAKKLINQGMIQGMSAFVYRLNLGSGYLSNGDEEENSISIKDIPPVFISSYFWKKLSSKQLSEEDLRVIDKTKNAIIENLKNRFPTKAIELNYRFDLSYPINVDVNIVRNNELDIDEFKNWREEYKNAEFILEDGKYICGSEVEKMSKSKYNVVTPDLMVEQHGADCLRLYEMFLGPLELSKPWNTNGITGVSGFIKKLWRLYHTGAQDSKLETQDLFNVSNEPATKPELKILHKTIKKITHDIENFSFNTSVSNFMICVNELTDLKCHKREILEPLAIILSPYAPHIAEELWSKLGHTESITYAKFPECKEEYLVETAFNYPVSFNGKTRFFVELDRSLSKEDVEKEVMAMEQTHKYLEEKTPKKIIVVPNKIVNIVL